MCRSAVFVFAPSCTLFVVTVMLAVVGTPMGLDGRKGSASSTKVQKNCCCRGPGLDLTVSHPIGSTMATVADRCSVLSSSELIHLPKQPQHWATIVQRFLPVYEVSFLKNK